MLTKCTTINEAMHCVVLCIDFESDYGNGCCVLRSEQTTAPHVTIVTSTPFKNGSTGSTAVFARRRILTG